VQKQKMGEVGN